MMETSRLKPPQPDGCVRQGRGTNTGYLGTRSCSSRGEQKGYFPRRASQKLKALCVCVFQYCYCWGKIKVWFCWGTFVLVVTQREKHRSLPRALLGAADAWSPPQVLAPLTPSLLLQAMASFLALIDPICWQQPSASPARQPHSTKA